MNKLPKDNLLSKSPFNRMQFLSMIPIILLNFVYSPSNANEFDQRQVILLNEAQQAHVLTEMRSILDGTQAIVAALAIGDMATVATYARPLGMKMKQKPEDKLHNVLPKAFKMMGKAVHLDFDRIADDAERLKDPKHTLQQLGEILNRCKGCHENFKINVASTVMEDKKLENKP